jgi:hypothetical protein
VSGEGRVRRVPGSFFPAHEVVFGSEVVAHLGRYSWWSIYFRRGQRVLLADREWRLAAITRGRAICPLLVDEEGRRVATTAVGARNYGIQGRDFAYVLNPTGPGRPDAWTLWIRDVEEVGVVRRRSLSVFLTDPVPLAVVLLAWVLVRFGIPGEGPTGVPVISWGPR